MYKRTFALQTIPWGAEQGLRGWIHCFTEPTRATELSDEKIWCKILCCRIFFTLKVQPSFSEKHPLFTKMEPVVIPPSKKRRNIDPKHQFLGGSMFAFRGVVGWFMKQHFLWWSTCRGWFFFGKPTSSTPFSSPWMMVCRGKSSQIL